MGEASEDEMKAMNERMAAVSFRKKYFPFKF
jgi:hypothetical protein